MKRTLIFALIAFSTFAQAADITTVVGKIDSVRIGEFDPFAVGDACVVVVKTERNKKIAFVTDFDECINSEDDLKVGRGVHVALDTATRIKQKKVLSILREQVRASKFYTVEFGAIENGLADE